MTGAASTWERIEARLFRAIPVILMLLWLIQIGYWIRWETGNQSVDPADEPSPTDTAPDVVMDTPPLPADEPSAWPESPFTPPTFFQLKPEPAQPPEKDAEALPEPDSLTAEEKGEPEPPAAPPPPDPAAALRLLNYKGFMQTPDGNRIAFMEDKKNNAMLRLQIGEAIGDWELATIARDRIVFASEDEPDFEILRESEGREGQP